MTSEMSSPADPARMKALNERVIGDKFISAYNAHDGTNLQFKARPLEAPDLTYSDGTKDLNIEVCCVYYDDADAKWQWQAARGFTNRPTGWSGANFDAGLVGAINNILAEKSAKDYGSNCILVVHVRPPLTTINDMRELLNDIRLPPRQPFRAIYLSGDFPTSADSAGGYACWRLDSRD